MMKNKIFLIIGLILLFLSGCNKEKKEMFQGSAVNFGESNFYYPFLGVQKDTIILEKKLRYEFNDFAKEKKSFINIKLIDEQGEILNDKNIQFFVNGKQDSNYSFNIKSSDSQKGNIRIGLKILPKYKEGYSTGFLVVTNHNLDRVNENELNVSNEKRLFKWDVTHTIVMNPLKKVLFWILSLILIFLLLWFIIFRNILHPKFKKGKIQILSPYFGGFNIGGNIKKVIFTNKAQKQNLLNKIFTGVIKYEVNPIFESDITLRPGRKNKIKIKLPINSKISPPVIYLEKLNNYKIETNKQIIEIQYS